MVGFGDKGESKVYFANIRSCKNLTELADKIDILYEKLNISNSISKEDFVAVKMHFGEEGNPHFVKPFFVKKVIEKLKKSSQKIFLTDTNTLYIRKRTNAIDHLKTAISHGFRMPEIDVPIIIADGLIGRDYVEVEINQRHFKKVKISSGGYYADVIIGIAHFKGHLETGFGGAIKNIGMGFGSRSGKQMMHSAMKPSVIVGKCKACKECIKWCPGNAITIEEGSSVAYINEKKCFGCGECIASCKNHAVEIRWESTPEEVQERIVEYAYGAIKNKKCTAYFNFLLGITPNCDCLPEDEKPIVNDIGILSSTDIVAIDQASVDLVNAQEGLKNSDLKCNFNAGEDKFRGIRNIDWSVQLSYGEKIGLGSRTYKLVEV